MFLRQRARIVDIAAKHRLPTMFWTAEFVAACSPFDLQIYRPALCAFVGLPFPSGRQAESHGSLFAASARALSTAARSSNAYVIEGITGVIIYLNRKHKSKHGSSKITGIDETVAR